MSDETTPPDEPETPENGGEGSAPLPDGIEPISIESELKSSYLDYAMSVIVSRALPDVRDGLKPVHRRILYAMDVGGNTPSKPYKKSANIVGAVMGNYHPHGDSAIYDALVRMAQPFSMGVTLVDGQGNFGSIDNDPPAAMRYTESRMTKEATYLLADIDKDTVDFQDNYDGSQQEPVVLPAQFPNLLVNGAGGIAVGMATNIPPHNLGEVIDATLAVIDDPTLDEDALLEIVPGPDFPTGGLIMGMSGSRKALTTGRGSVIMRAKTDIEEAKNGRQAIIVTEIPYQVNKAAMITKIAELVREKRIEGIADLRDESDRNGIRVVVELKKDASAEVVLNQLYRFSQMQTSFGVNMLALNGGRPELMNLRKVLDCFVTFRQEVVVRRTKFELNKARDRAHVLVGLAMAVANIDEVIRIIRYSPDPNSAREALLEKAWPIMDMGPLLDLIADRRTRKGDGDTIFLSDEQARAILALQLSRLTGLGRDEIGNEAKGLSEKIEDFLDILRSRQRVMDIIKGELSEVKEKFAVPRRSEFAFGGVDMEDEDLIEVEDMVVTVTHGGYVKRTPLSTYRTQHRGGKGRSGMNMKDEDFVVKVFSATTHTEVLFFSSAGMVYKEKVWRLPMGGPNSRGKALVNIFPLAADERIESVMPLPEDDESRNELDVMFATRSGTVRRNKLPDFVRVNRNGKIAMKLDEGDGIVSVKICSEKDDILLTTALGQCIRFAVPDVRVFAGRNSTGVRGIRLADGDEVISMGILRHIDVTSEEARAYLKHAAAMRRAATGEEEEVSDDDDEAVAEAALSAERIAELGAAEEFILTIADDGMGKRSSAYDYRVTGRGGKGLVAQNIWGRDKKQGPVKKVAQSFTVDDGDQVMLVTDAGQLIRTPVDQIRIAGRSTGGVWVLRTAEGERVVSVARLVEDAETAMDGPEEAAGE
ncbi:MULTISPECIES: DNA gyrase subunit A [Hyphomonas]|jgi:DNA gyrase subunit A|uniref:DNA gyrase subunit A n=2 Tax=Hyphomonas atlantica TaxID=1280948 RepID=A0A059DZG3_9PROT|nr:MULTISPECIES: DNA gyrase subunit A [Hyphomonas]KCZ59732.1 DNA gyrase subunit A [Hyphomonas atlantica]MAH93717.1 DNA gyrase subunit A [Hyphomonas sp.]OUX84386.1 MAG: DNA gyrase subunit A [Hyphomonas sp. TMED31]